MSDICVSCGDASSDEDGGRYVEFEPREPLTIWIERWVCNDCLIDNEYPEEGE